MYVQDYDETLPIVTTAITGGLPDERSRRPCCSKAWFQNKSATNPAPRPSMVHNGFVAPPPGALREERAGVALPLDVRHPDVAADSTSYLCSLSISQRYSAATLLLEGTPGRAQALSPAEIPIFQDAVG